MGTVSSSGGSVSGLLYGTNYYLVPTYTSTDYTLDSWSKGSTYGTLSSISAANPYITVGTTSGTGAVGITITGKSNSCTVYCTSSTSCSTTRPTSGFPSNGTANYNGTAGLYGVFTCTNGSTGRISSCYYYGPGGPLSSGFYHTICDNSMSGLSPTFLCTTGSSRQYDLYNTCTDSLTYDYLNPLGMSGSGYSCSC